MDYWVRGSGREVRVRDVLTRRSDPEGSVATATSTSN